MFTLKFRSIEPKSTGFIDFNGFLRLLFLDEKCLSPITVAKNLFKEFDYDESGTIGIDEFGKMMRDIYALETGNVEFRIKQEFSRVDTDGSGQISIAGLLKFFRNLILEFSCLLFFVFVSRNGKDS